MSDANVWEGCGEAVLDLVENMRLWARKLESADFGTATQAAEDAHSVRLLIKAQIGAAAKLRDQIFYQVTEERDKAARQAAKIERAASIFEHKFGRVPRAVEAVGAPPDAEAPRRIDEVVVDETAPSRSPDGDIKDVRAPPKQNTFVDDLNTSVWPAISSAQAASIVALKAEIERLKGSWRLDGKVFEELNDALTNAGVPCVAITLVDAVNRVVRERDSKAGTVEELLKDIADRNRVIAERDEEIARLRQGILNFPPGEHPAPRIPIVAQPDDLSDLPDDLRADMQAMDVAEAKSQLASDEGIKVARVLVAKLRKKYDQDVVQGIVDDLIRTKQTGGGLHGLSPGEKEFVCLSRVHIADDPAPHIETQRSASSAVDHPDHYGGADNPYEAIKVIEAWNLEFCTGSAVKYIARAGKKDATRLVEDLQKAVWYLRRRIEQLGGTDDANTASLVRKLFEIYDRPCKPDGSWEHVAEYKAIEKKVRVLVGAPPSTGDK